MAVQLPDIGLGPLTHILLFMDVPSIASASQACTVLHEAAQNDVIWQRKASELFPPATLLLDGYGTFQSLVKDNNRLHASLVLLLTGKRCIYKHSAPDYYFECRLLSLQYLPGTGNFRLFFDARGEEDLRHPSQSSLGFTVNRSPAALLASWQRWHQRLLAQLAGARSDAERASLQAEIVQHDAQRRALLGPGDGQEGGGGWAEPVFQDLLTVVRPAGCTLLVEQPGHYMGYLGFEERDLASTILDELPNTYASKAEALQYGLELIFCYANPVPVMPVSAMVDYHPCSLLSVLPGETLEGVLLREGHHAPNDEPLEQLREQSMQHAQRASWAHVGEALLARDPPWMV